ncbi:MFS transporter [Micromonospora sp. BRA006-A]|nr:MFS transporter [Micromonospora sp. BRA006-A]
MLPCLVVEAIGTGSLALVDSTASAFGVMTLIAVGSSAIWAGQNTILASLTDDGERQRVFGLNFALLNLGIGTGGADLRRGGRRGPPDHLRGDLPAGRGELPDPRVDPAHAAARRAPPGLGRRREADDQRTGGYLTVLRDRPFRRLVVFGLVLTTCGYAQIEVGFAAYSVRVVEVTPRVVAWALAANTVMIVLSQLLVIRRLEGRSRTRALATVGAVFAGAWLVLGAAGVVGSGNAVLAALGVVACSAIFGFGETMLSPVMPAITNALATDELRGRYNAMSSMIFGISGVVGPVTAGPLIGAANGRVWVAVVVGGCLAASLLALSLRPLLTAAQDGRPTAAATPAPEPARAT